MLFLDTHYGEFGRVRCPNGRFLSSAKWSWIFFKFQNLDRQNSCPIPDEAWRPLSRILALSQPFAAAARRYRVFRVECISVLVTDFTLVSNISSVRCRYILILLADLN